MTAPTVAGSAVTTGDLAAALMAMFSQLVGNALGQQAVDKDGKPLRDICYMQLPSGRPVDPREFANPWNPAGAATIADTSTLGQLSPTPAGASTDAAAQAAQQAQAAKQIAASMKAAQRTSELVDMRMKVTTDGSYLPFQGSELISTAYQGIILKAQGVQADPPPADIQAKIDAARKTLWVMKDDGSMTGRKTDTYQRYEDLSKKWADARTRYAEAEAAASKDPSLGAVWPVTSSSLQQDVDNAWDDWRSSGADEVENALDTLGSIGGSIGAYFVSQARELYKAWDLGLTGAVPVGTPYAEISPETWYDPTDEQNGFAGLSVSSSHWQGSSFSSANREASSWYSGHSSSTGGGGGGMIFGITFGVDASHADASSSWGKQGSGGTFHSWSSSMSSVTIEYEWGMCTIYRPFLLSELFIVDDWYLPQEPKNCVSDGTVGGAVAGQQHDDAHPDDPETHLLPMITTQFLVVRNVKITADGWGETGNAMSSWCNHQQGSDQSRSNTVTGGVGFLGLGGYVSDSNADWSGQDSASDACSGSWFFDGDSEHGTLTINGCQIVGWVGEILPASPRVDGSTRPATASTATAGTATTQGAATH